MVNQLNWVRPTVLLLIVIALYGCNQNKVVGNGAGVGAAKFQDPAIIALYQYKDQRQTDSILPYLNHPNAAYRLEGAMAMASVQDAAAVGPLVTLLADTNPLVRKNAAFALGQTFDTTAQKGLMAAYATEKQGSVRIELLQALGKCANQQGLAFMLQLPDTVGDHSPGVAWGLYRAGLRGVHSQQAIEKALSILQYAANKEARLGAAHFLQRTRTLELDAHLIALEQLLIAEQEAEVTMALTLALNNVNKPEKQNIINELLLPGRDYRVRVNAVRTVTEQIYPGCEANLLAILEEEAANPNLKIAVAEAIAVGGFTPPVNKLLQLAQANSIDRVKADLLGVALLLTPDKTDLANELKAWYANAQTDYAKGHILLALSHVPDNYEFVAEALFTSKAPIIKTQAISGLAGLRTDDNFPKSLNGPFATIFKQAIESEDVAVMAIAASVIASLPSDFAAAYQNNYAFIEAAQQKLPLPEAVETYIALQAALNKLTGTEAPTMPTFEEVAPNWQAIASIPPRLNALIQTTKGDVTLQLWVEAAPVTVHTFMELATAGFYNNRYFHRVVPNFVAQGGGPRGDGYGSLDYSIRSEFPNLSYREGAIGLASAGKDTESCQWFITHSPTPHLDGRYTQFGQVITGMDVVHQLQVGDQILGVKILPAQGTRSLQ